MSELPTGTVTFLFTDLEGSTRLWEEYPEAMRPALARHDEILRDAVEGHNGQVVKTTGDGLHAAFGTAHDAVDAAVGTQLALASEAWEETGPLTVRIGVHTCEAEARDGDYYGTGVNRAARLMGVAHGGQVLVSAATSELVRDRSVELLDLGEHRLRDLGRPERIFQMVHPDLGRDFPPLQSVDAVPTNLPTVRTELIGRSDDIEALAELVARERLVTLTGVGGVGKTRLALGVAATLAADYADGCWLVELAPVAGGDEVAKVTAAAMRSPTTDLDALAAYLADRRVLIVLDNCEHVLDAAADLVDAVLESAPEVHVVVTSREPLGLDGEQVRRVQSLGVPDEHADASAARSAAAVRLFTERAAAVADGFAVDAGNVEAVVEICRHLDGIPLAIELAAARVRAMPPEEIASRLDERFRLLAGGSRRSQERHRTLLATVAWSHDLLTEDEKVTFRRLTVFHASFDLAAAEAVAGDGGVDVVECVLRLVDRSLVVYEPETGRYRLLETLRQFGADRLADASETEPTRERHARHFLGLVEVVAPGLGDTRFPVAEAALVIELDNLRATADWCVEVDWWSELAGMCQQLWWFITGVATVDGAAWYRQFIDHGSALDEQVVVDSIGELAFLQGTNFGNFAVAMALSEQSRDLADAHRLHEPQMAWLATAMAAMFTGEHSAALDASGRALEGAEARGDERVAVTALCVQSNSLAALGEFERGGEVAAAAVRRAEELGQHSVMAAAVVNAATVPLMNPDGIDFAACLEVLTSHPVEVFGGATNAMWLDIMWATAELALQQPGAVERWARAARAADQLHSLHAFDIALRFLAVVAAGAGLGEHAQALVAYTEANLRPYRMQNPQQGWVQERLDQLLAGLPATSPGPAPPRGEIMRRITEIEAALA
jgi:predicted ATPase/class 3 adenylate cyclase